MQRILLVLVSMSLVIHLTPLIAFSQTDKERYRQADEYIKKGNTLLREAFTYTGGKIKSYDKAIESIECFSKAIELYPTIRSAHANRGYVYYLLGEYKKALADYDIDLELRPNYADGYFWRGVIHYKLGSCDSARKDFRKAIELYAGWEDAVRRSYSDCAP